MKGIILFLTGLVIGAAATFFVAQSVISKKIFIENESTMSFEETADMVAESAQNNGWTVSHIYDLQASLKKKDFEVPQTYVFSLCNPSVAVNILGTDNERMASAVMPCRVSVYKKGEKTYVSTLNSKLFSRFLNKNAKHVFAEAHEKTNNILKPVIN